MVCVKRCWARVGFLDRWPSTGSNPGLCLDFCWSEAGYSVAQPVSKCVSWQLTDGLTA